MAVSRMFVVDGYKFHANIDILKFAIGSKIRRLLLWSRSFPVTQPLNVCVLGVFKPHVIAIITTYLQTIGMKVPKKICRTATVHEV